MFRPFALVLLVACGAPEGSLDTPQDAPAPPPAPAADFVVGQLIPGAPVRMTVAGYAQGDEVVFFASASGTGAGPCPSQLNGSCLDLLPPIVYLGGRTANADGWASRRRVAPNILQNGDLITFQAAVLHAGPAEVLDPFEREVGPGICPLFWSPVCGVNGQTYGNECEATFAGWPIAWSGPC